MSRAPVMSPMDRAAAARHVALQRCEVCGTGQYPPRELCRTCLSDRLGWSLSEQVPGELLAKAIVHHSFAPGTAVPQPVGLVRLGPGMTALCFIAESAQPGPVTITAESDSAGRAVLTAC